MNKARRAEISKAIELIEDAQEIIDEIAIDERDAFDNLSEGLQSTERGQAISWAADMLDCAQLSVEELLGDLRAAQEPI